MPWDRPTIKQLYERISQDFSGRLLDGGGVLARSVIAVLAKVWAGASHIMHGMLAWLFLQVFVDTAEGPYLERWARVWRIFRKDAAAAVGLVNFIGQDGASIPAGILMQHHASGQMYAVLEETAASGGLIAVTVRAASPGLAGNQPAGAPLTLIAPIAGVVSTGTVMADGISGGFDAEKDDSLRRRLLDRLGQPPRGGAKHDYEAWALEVPGVTRAWCYPMGLGLGTVSVAFVTDGAPDGPIPTTQMLDRVREYIEGKRPSTVKEWAVFAPEVLPITIRLIVNPDTTAVRLAVQSELADLIDLEGMPDTDHNTEVWLILLSHIRQAIGQATGVRDYSLIEPAANIEVYPGYFPILAGVLFEDAP